MITAGVLGLFLFGGHFVEMAQLQQPGWTRMMPHEWSPWIVNASVLWLFALQHSVMARPAFQQKIPEQKRRPWYVISTSICLLFLLTQWRPVAGWVWEVTSLEGRIGLGIAAMLGSLLVLWSAKVMGVGRLLGWTKEPVNIPFQTPGLYRWIRHPQMLGVLSLVWAVPLMTYDRFFFALGITLYVRIALIFEERDLIHEFGSRYENYRKQVPMLFPWKGRGWDQ
jgi:protein-S-isoprenylcysteine O-methyltransferase Ste14